MSTQLKTRYLFIVRHGERMDHLPDEYPEYADHPDAPLTPKGHEQAELTAVFLKQYISNLGGECPVRTESSPFNRCLQTAMAINKHLSLTESTINYRFMEIMFPD